MPAAWQIARVSHLAERWGLIVPTEPVCRGHYAPGYFVAEWVYDRPSQLLVWGPRGGGKSQLRAYATHLNSFMNPGFHTVILGGSLSQSQQIYGGINGFREAQPGDGLIASITKERAVYTNGSDVAILAASVKSVHGPHVPELCLDELDEIDEDIRERAIPMAMAIGPYSSSIAMTSTYHNIGGPMSRLVGKIPTRTFCIFEVLERCPEERSGPHLEKCPDCPIVQWCHSDRESRPDGLPKAKRSRGHYKIDTLLQKKTLMTLRALESDFFSLRPRGQGVWFAEFDSVEGGLHVRDSAGFDRSMPFHISIDHGVHTAAVWYQIHRDWQGLPLHVTVFADHYADGLAPDANAGAIRQKTIALTGVGPGWAEVSIDPNAGARTAVGPSVRAEYLRAGCAGRDNVLKQWPPLGHGRPKADELALVEVLLKSAEGEVSLTIHPSCKHLIDAFQQYARAKRNGHYVDYPEAEAHPQEDLIDALAGGLRLAFPQGRKPRPRLEQHSASMTV